MTKTPSRAAPRRRSRPTPAALAKRVLELGAVGARVIRPSTVVTAAWVRLKCRYGCGGWNSSLCCPPHTPGPAETRALLAEYRTAVLFQGRPTKKIAVALEREAFLGGYHKAFALGAGPCTLCREPCTFAEGCRHAELARPAMEACGIDVFATVRRHGFAIEVVRDRQDEPHYFGLVLLE